MLSNSWHTFNTRLVFSKRLTSSEKPVSYKETNTFSLVLNISSQRKHFQNKIPLIWFWAHDFQHKFHFPLYYLNICRTEIKKMKFPQLAHFEEEFTQFTWLYFKVFKLTNIKAWNMATKTNSYSRTPLGGTSPRNTWETCSAREAKSLQSTFPESI